METRFMTDPQRYATMTTAQIRETFLIDALYQPGELRQVYVDLDRVVVGMAAPLRSPIALAADQTLHAKDFTERRELGVWIACI
jgi:4-deoxy-L-threo-5-hexosulose-uronate ketol-isomerase